MHWTIWLLISSHVVVWLPMGYGIWSKRRAGSVLLKLGRSSRDKMGLVAAGISGLPLIGLLWGFFRSGEMKEFSEVLLGLAIAALYLPLAAYLVFFTFAGLVISESGIFANGRLVKWERIESYGLGEKTLVVTWNRRWYEVQTGRVYEVLT